MKKIITSVSIAAIGAVSLQAASAPGLTSKETSKWWNVSLALRGFYDDNISTAPSGPGKLDSFGFDVSPSVNAHYVGEQTSASLGYTYGYKYFDSRDPHGDQRHLVDGKVNHAFTENYRLEISDSFAVAQEPEAFGGGSKIRVKGDNLRNFANLKLNADFTRLFGIEFGFGNNYYDYSNENINSYSALLNRLEYYPYLDFRYRIQPSLVGLIGYRYGRIDHTSDQFIPGIGQPDVRDANMHFFYAGVDYSMSSQLITAVRVGAQYADYFNADQAVPGANFKSSALIPYADASVKYVYTTGSYAQLGIRNTFAQSEYDAQSETDTTIYGSINHAFTPKLIGSLLGQYTFSQINGGPYNNGSENYFVVGINLNYQFNQYLGADVGYNYDDLSSDVPARGYNRNRVYLGLTASY